MPTSFTFTETKVRALKPPADGRDREYHKDSQCRGLQVCVTGTGAKTYYLVRRLNGQPARLLLGKTDQLSVTDARRAAARHAGDMAAGGNPQADRRQKRHEMTMGQLIDQWKQHAKANKRSWAEDWRMADKHLAHWATRRLSAIRKAEVHALHLRLADEAGKYLSNRVCELLRAMYNYAKENLGYTGENPTAGVKRFPEEKRDRFLHANELGAFFSALQSEAEVFQHFFLLLLLTGARRSNVQAMRWDAIDLALALWRIPGEEAKAGVPIVVPLTAAALDVLHARQNANGHSEWVFPSKGKTGHIVEPKAAWKRIVQRAGLVDVRPHDLRRSLGSWMAIGGASLPVVGGMLGHSQPRTTAIYARLCVDPIRAAAQAATDAMMAHGGSKLLLAPAAEGGDDAT